ncbi:MAG: transposase [Solirubrobacterales bacterium]|nr:transposase [Solirubrobacterales bacterium]
MLAGRRYRLYLTPGQAEQATRASGCCRAIWNAALKQRELAWELRRERVWAIAQMAELPELKRAAGFEWLARDGIAQSLQQSLRDLDVAYRRWLAGRGGRPRFKAKGRRESFRLPQGRDLSVRKVNRRWAEVRVLKLGWCRFRLTRPIGGEIRHATVSRDALGWQISFCVALEQPPAKPNGGPPVGVDRGVAATVALSTGELHSCPGLPSGQAQRLRRLCRKAGRRETLRRRRPNGHRRRSRRHQRTLDQIARLKARDARIRADFLHKLSTRLASAHGLIAIEHLRVGNMTRSAKGTLAQPGVNVAQKRALNRRILAQGWGELRRELRYKAAWHGSVLVEVPAEHSSQTCSACGVVHADSRKSQAEFRCVACGHQQHADVNAARVILARAVNGQEDGGRIWPLQRGEPSRRRPGPRTANPRWRAA